MVLSINMNIIELHNKINKHINNQEKEWNSFIYGKEKGLYQGFKLIGIEGCRDTEERLNEYKIEKYLSKKKTALDIGSNCGFLAIFVSRFLKSVEGVEINPHLVGIANDTKGFLKVKNTNFKTSSFENYNTNKKFDIIFSLANDSTIDGNTKFNFNEYIQKIISLLKPKGSLIFESQAHDMLMEEVLNSKKDLLRKYFNIVEEKTIKSAYPIGVESRLFIILEPRNSYKPNKYSKWDGQ